MPDGAFREVTWNEYRTAYREAHGYEPDPWASHAALVFRGANVVSHPEPTIIASSKTVSIPVPDDINILPSRRIGDAIRSHYAEHLANMHVLGHLDEQEFEARQNHALAARIQEELDELVRDLPPPPRRSRAKVAVEKHTAGEVAIDMLGHPVILISVLAFGIPGAISAATTMGMFLFIAVMVLVVGLFIRTSVKEI